MRFRRALLLPALAASLALAACGDGPDDPAVTATVEKPGSPVTTPQVAKTGTPQPRPSTGQFAEAPRLGRAIVKVSPAHGTAVTQASTRSPNARQPGGICIDADFTVLPEANLTWFRMIVDGVEVTQKMTWVVPQNDNQAPKGKGCYAPVDGLLAGRHDVAVGVNDPQNPSAPTFQVVQWEFDVTQ